jgi:4-amino-4-deoxy-L-arabinose transferase-like glycosyltransferase
MSIDEGAAALAVVLLVGLIVFQPALACGAPWGRAAYGGRHDRLPVRLRVTSAVAALFWAVVTLIFLPRTGLFGAAPPPGAMNWVAVGIFAAATLLNAATRSRVERAIWLPISALLLASSLILAVA